VRLTVGQRRTPKPSDVFFLLEYFVFVDSQGVKRLKNVSLGSWLVKFFGYFAGVSGLIGQSELLK